MMRRREGWQYNPIERSNYVISPYWTHVDCPEWDDYKTWSDFDAETLHITTIIETINSAIVETSFWLTECPSCKECFVGEERDYIWEDE